MTEQEYINVRDVTNIANAIHILTDITLANQPAISQDDFSLVIMRLRRWQINIRKSCHVAAGQKLCVMCGLANDNGDEHPRCLECTRLCDCCKDAVASKLTWATVRHSDGTDQGFPVRTCEDCDPTHAMLEAMPPVR